MTSARPDTRYLADSASIITDDSQRATNLTADGATGYEDNSARTAIAGDGAGRAIELSVELTDAQTGTILDVGSDEGFPLAEIRANLGDVEFYVGASSVATITAPNVGALAATYVIAWASYDNPQATGAPTRILSVFMVYDVDGDELVYTTAAHATGSPTSSMAFAVGGRYNGANVVNKWGGAINDVRYSARFHTRVETREHFVAATSAPVVDGITSLELQPIPADACTRGSLVGPQLQHAAASLAPTASRYRLLGPVIQACPWTPPTWLSSLSETVAASWVRTLDDGYQTHLGWTWRREIPRQAEWLLAWVQWASWNTSAEAVDVTLRLYVSDQPPHLATDWNYVELTRAVDDGVGGGIGGAGVIEYFAEVFLARDLDGFTWIWLGLSITEATPLATKLNLRWFSCAPMAKEPIADQPPDPWGP
jgi:hypothetical protein